MRLTIWLTVAICVSSPTYCLAPEKEKKKGIDKFISDLFAPKKPEVKKKPVHRTVKKRSPRKIAPKSLTVSLINKNYFVVDAQWIANYLEQETAWDYPIPEDEEIIFDNGNYYVPPVVYRHYEDMVSARNRRSLP